MAKLERLLDEWSKLEMAAMFSRGTERASILKQKVAIGAQIIAERKKDPMAARKKKKKGSKKKKAKKAKSLMPESVIRKHANKLKRNARAAKIYRSVLGV